MPNQTEAAETLKRYLTARVPLIVVRSIERSRSFDLVKSVGAQFKSMSFYYHSRATGLYEVSGQSPVSDDRSLVGALDYAAATFAARQHANFIFTDVDDLGSDTATARHVAEMARLADNHVGSIIVISAEPVWSGLARLGMSVTLDLPDIDELYFVVNALVDDHRGVMPVEWRHEQIRQAAEILVGVTQAEAINALTTLLAKGSLLTADVAELSMFKDQIFGELAGIERVQVRSGEFRVGGLTNLREWLRPKRDLMATDLSATRLHPPRGVLLVGIPGCGKSLCAKAIAADWRIPLYRLDMASILGMYVGQSENRLKEALETTDRVAPCVLWVDEIEKAFSIGHDGGTSRRLVGQFLYWLQESTSKVFLVATANDVRTLPPELLRKGRFDELFFVDLPDEEDRAEIIRMYFDKYLTLDPSPFLVRELAELSEGFAGSDIEAVVHDIATMHLVRQNTEPLTDDHVKRAFANVLPFSQTNPEDVAAIRAWGQERAKPAGRAPDGGTADRTGSLGARRIIVAN